MISGLLTSTLTQQAVTYPVFEAESHRPEDRAEIDRATIFSAYDGNTIALGWPRPPPKLQVATTNNPSFSRI